MKYTTGVVAVLNDKLRVIHGKDGLQWLLQVRKSPTRWESIAFWGADTKVIIAHAKAFELRPRGM